MSKRKSLTTVIDERFPPERCETCRFWGGGVRPYSTTHDIEAGYCHRYPPVVRGEGSTFDLIDVYESGVLPLTYIRQWCGEWQPKR